MKELTFTELAELKHRYAKRHDEEEKKKNPPQKPDKVGRIIGALGLTTAVATAIMAKEAIAQNNHATENRINQIRSELSIMRGNIREIREEQELNALGDCVIEWGITKRKPEYFNTEVCRVERQGWKLEQERKGIK